MRDFKIIQLLNTADTHFALARPPIESGGLHRLKSCLQVHSSYTQWLVYEFVRVCVCVFVGVPIRFTCCITILSSGATTCCWSLDDMDDVWKLVMTHTGLPAKTRTERYSWISLVPRDQNWLIPPLPPDGHNYSHNGAIESDHIGTYIQLAPEIVRMGIKDEF